MGYGCVDRAASASRENQSAIQVTRSGTARRFRGAVGRDSERVIIGAFECGSLVPARLQAAVDVVHQRADGRAGGFITRYYHQHDCPGDQRVLGHRLAARAFIRLDAELSDQVHIHILLHAPSLTISADLIPPVRQRYW